MHRYVDGQMDGRMRDVWMNGGQMDDGQMDEWVDG